MDVGIRELRDGLSAHLAEVRAGRTLVVTDHGRPIARIVPVGRPSRLDALRAEGRITRAARRKRPSGKPVAGGQSVSDLVVEQRR